MAETLTNEQRRQILALVEAQSWGDIDYAMRAVDEALLRAIEATTDDFLLWEQEADAAGFADEFTVEADEVAAMSPEWRLAYLARVIRSLALSYGLQITEFSEEASLLREADSIAALVRGLNDAIHLPPTSI